MSYGSIPTPILLQENLPQQLLYVPQLLQLPQFLWELWKLTELREQQELWKLQQLWEQWELRELWEVWEQPELQEQWELWDLLYQELVGGSYGNCRSCGSYGSNRNLGVGAAGGVEQGELWE